MKDAMNRAGITPAQQINDLSTNVADLRKQVDHLLDVVEAQAEKIERLERRLK